MSRFLQNLNYVNRIEILVILGVVFLLAYIFYALGIFNKAK